jgi:hypothetical protein
VDVSARRLSGTGTASWVRVWGCNPSRQLIAVRKGILQISIRSVNALPVALQGLEWMYSTGPPVTHRARRMTVPRSACSAAASVHICGSCSVSDTFSYYTPQSTHPDFGAPGGSRNP